MTTLRWCPWLEKTVMVICDIADEETGEPVEVAPRQILKRQIERAKKMDLTIKTGTELEFYLFRDSYDDIAEGGYRNLRPTSTYIMDYHMLQTTKDEWIIRQIRNGMLGAGIPVEFSKGEFGKGQHEINITYADALSTADYHALYKHGVKEICAANGVAATFMAKWTMDEAGSSCHVHSSAWDKTGKKSLMYDAKAPHHLSDDLPPLHGWADGDRTRDVVHVRAVRELLQAVPARLVGPDRDRLEPRQPHLRVPDRRRARRRAGGDAASRAAT